MGRENGTLKWKEESGGTLFISFDDWEFLHLFERDLPWMKVYQRQFAVLYDTAKMASFIGRTLDYQIHTLKPLCRILK